VANDRAIQTGSVRSVFHDLPVVGEPGKDEKIEVRLILRYNPEAAKLPSLERLGAQRLHERNYMGVEEFSRKYGAAPEDIAAVEAFARDYDLKVEEVDGPRHLIKLSGTVQAVCAAFGVVLRYYQHANGTSLGHRQEISLPAELDHLVDAVLGLDHFPTGQCQLPAFEVTVNAGGPPQITGYTPLELEKLYNFPTDLDGAGECIAILALGGGFDPDVLQSYFTYLGLPMPDISWVSADAGNDYNPDNRLTHEIMVDIEVAGAIAPGARIVVYFGPTDGYIRTLHTAVNDATNNPSVISISFSSPEILMTAPELKLYDRLVRDAALKGMSICAASGDTGSNICASKAQSPLGFVNNLALTNFPPSNPGVLGCGGTFMTTAVGQIGSEVAYNALGWLFSADPTDNNLPSNWGATGGGVSIIYPLPSYQERVDVDGATNHRVVFDPSIVREKLRSPVPVPPRGRGVPDVAAHSIGYKVLIKGTAPNDLTLSGGTSAVTALWAGLIARLNQGLKQRLGFLHPILYNDLSPGALRRITRGSNGAYEARPDLQWNACTGLGVPNGSELLRQLKHLSHSSGPQ
jgi:kumamolisin